MTIVSFILFLAFAGALTWFIVRKQDVGSNTGFFLAGRSLTYPLIAASLLLTNLSTEQMVGLNGSAFRQGLCVMAWEVVAVVSLVAMAWFFLPKFLKSGVTTVPEYLELRYGKSTGTIANAIFLFFYVFLLLPLILYTGAVALKQILDFQTLLPGLSDTAILWIAIWLIGLMGCAYSLFGGLRTCAVLDTINGIGLLIGGFMIVFFALSKVSAINGGELSLMQSLSEVKNAHSDMFNTFGRPKSEVPFGTLFTGVLIINMFYWCTNQQIIQRTFGAKGLAEGQKGVLLCGLLKLLGPLYLVLPGMIAFYFACKGLLDLDMNSSALAYGKLVTFVLPNWLAGFFGAVLIGAVLSSFNGALNSSCTLFSIGFYKGLINPQAEDKKVVRSGRIFGLIIAVLCMCGAPLLANTSSIFDYLQKTNGIYNIPLFAIIVVGMLTKFVPKMAANVALFVGVVLIAFLTFGDPATVQKVTRGMNIYHVDTVVFLILVAIMGIWSFVAPRKEAFVQQAIAGLHVVDELVVGPLALGKEQGKDAVLLAGQEGMLLLHALVEALAPGGQGGEVLLPPPVGQKQGRQRQVFGTEEGSLQQGVTALGPLPPILRIVPRRQHADEGQADVPPEAGEGARGALHQGLAALQLRRFHGPVRRQEDLGADGVGIVVLPPEDGADRVARFDEPGHQFLRIRMHRDLLSTSYL